MTTHAETEQLSAYLDGELAEREQISVEAHVAGCTECAAVLDALRATLRDLGDLGEPAADEQLSWGIRSAVSRERKRSGPLRKRLWALGGVAAASVAIVAGIVATNHRGEQASTAGRSTNHSVALSLPQAVDEQALQSALAGLVVERSIALNGTGSLNTLRTDSQEGAPAAGSYDSNGPFQGGNVPKVMAVPQPIAGSAVRAPDPVQDQARACEDRIKSTARSANTLLVYAARFNKELVFVFFMETPANKPDRIEMRVVTRNTCEVRLFRQQRLPAP